MLMLLLVLAIIYFAIGSVLAVFVSNGSNLLGRIIVLFIWPYVLLVEGTPRIRWLTHLSDQEVVIEESMALDGSIRQTVRQHTGHEYIRIKGK